MLATEEGSTSWDTILRGERNGFRQLLLHKAKLDEDSGYNLYLEDLRYFDGDVNELKKEPHQVGDHCEVWDISEFPPPAKRESDAEKPRY